MKKLLLSVCTLLLIFPLGLMADSVDPYNSGPVTIGAPAPGEESVQQILNQIYGPNVVNANTDQEMTGEWSSTSSTLEVTLVAEYASYANSNTFGIWSPGTDSLKPTMLEVFDGSAAPGSMATIAFLTNGDVEIGTGGSTRTFSGIDPSNFGFFLQGPGTNGGAFFTADSLNPGGNPQAIAYQGSGDATSIFFEDLPFVSGWSDINDQVVKIESLDPDNTSVPESSTLTLIGFGILALFGIICLRQKRAAML